MNIFGSGHWCDWRMFILVPGHSAQALSLNEALDISLPLWISLEFPSSVAFGQQRLDHTAMYKWTQASLVRSIVPFGQDQNSIVHTGMISCECEKVYIRKQGDLHKKDYQLAWQGWKICSYTINFLSVTTRLATICFGTMQSLLIKTLTGTPSAVLWGQGSYSHFTLIIWTGILPKSVDCTAIFYLLTWPSGVLMLFMWYSLTNWSTPHGHMS